MRYRRGNRKPTAAGANSPPPAVDQDSTAAAQADTPAPVPGEAGDRTRPSLTVRILLWVLAFGLAGAAMAYQRATGPTYPLKGTFSLGGETEYAYRFDRSHETIAGAPVAVVVPQDAPHLEGTLFWRRYPTKDEFAEHPMVETWLSKVEPGEEPDRSIRYAADLPLQPAAGKVEYFVTLRTPDGERRLPESGTVLLRYKDPVPDFVLIPHVVAMILVSVFGLRAALSALFDPKTVRRYAWISLTLMTVGGMMLGPLVQKYAFGEYWTGFPRGGDWTDNKMLVMWLAWVVACVVLGATDRPVTRIGRAAVVAAALVLTADYLIPHSMGGSQLDYSAVEQGVDPKDAIRTGRGRAG